MLKNKQEILSHLENILQSNEFKDSVTYKSLLNFLVEASIKNKIPKEITIAIEVFGKDPDFNSNKDSTVRHNIHTLKKKLDKYYKGQRNYEKVKFVIPKGHYEVKFFKNRSVFGLIFDQLKIKERIWLYSTLFFSLLCVYLAIMLQKSITDYTPGKENEYPFWSAFFDNNYETTIVIGDDFLLDEFSTELKRYRQIRDWEINSEADLNNFLRQFDNAQTWQSEIKGVPFGMLDNIFDLFHVIKNYNTKLSFNMSSQTNLKELKNNNLIYIGEFQNLRRLRKILFNLLIRFHYEPKEQLFILSATQDTIETFTRIEAPYQQENKFNLDYSVLASMPGPANEKFLFIVGFGYSGRLDRTKMLRDPEKIKEILTELNYTTENFPKYFIMVFEIESIERTGFKNTIKYFKAYEEQYFK